MQNDTHDVIWLDDSHLVSIDDLAMLSGLSAPEVHELVEMGALAPINSAEIPWRFSASCVVTVRRAGRLRDDLELDSHAVAVALMLLEQIRNLETELSQLRAQRATFRRF